MGLRGYARWELPGLKQPHLFLLQEWSCPLQATSHMSPEDVPTVLGLCHGQGWENPLANIYSLRSLYGPEQLLKG